MHGHASTWVGIIACSVVTAVGVWESRGTVIPLPKSAMGLAAPVSSNAYTVVSHSLREELPNFDYTIVVVATVRNEGDWSDANLRCTLPYAGNLYSREVPITASRGDSQLLVFRFAEPTILAGAVDNLLTNDPNIGYSFQIIGRPSKWWSAAKWLGLVGIAVCGLVFFLSPRKSSTAPKGSA
jgi:hypothetical protein